MPRTRERKILSTGSPASLTYWNAQGSFLRTDKYVTQYTSSISTITDVADNPLGNNPCDHLIIGRDMPVGNLLPKARRRDGTYVEICTSTIETYMPGHPFGTWAQRRPDLDWSIALDELERNASGDMSTSVNMVVNAAEVAELKGLAKGIVSSFKALTRRWLIFDRRVRTQLKGRARRGRRASLPSLKELADGHLGYSFGIAPLIQDISAFLDINHKIRERRQELAERNLRPTRIAARTTNVLEYKEEGLGVSLKRGYWASVQYNVEHWLKVTGVVSAVCTAFYNLDNPSTRWKHVSQALGLTSPLTSAWNLIPFSFVADWFIPIGKAIKRVERAGWDLVDEAAVTKAFTLTDYIHSTKVQCVSTVDTYAKRTDPPSWEGRKLGTQAERWTHYTRTVGKPAAEQWSMGQSSDWNVARTALSASLSIQRIRQTPKPMPKKWPSLDQIYTKIRHVRRAR